MVNSTTLTGGSASEFTIDSGLAPFTLGPNANRNVMVSFHPASTGAKSATLRIGSNDPDANPFDVALNGTGASAPPPIPDVTVTPTSHSYGNVVVGASSSKTFAVRNDGGVDLQVSGTTLVGANAGEFLIDSGGAPFTLIPNQSWNLVVNFNPASLGDKSATLQISNNDPDENPMDVSLSGTGIGTPPPGITLAEIKVGGSSSVNSVTTSLSLTGVDGHLYLAAISSKPNIAVTNVSGLGLTWTLVKAQCAGRSQARIEVWRAQGTPSGDEAVRATFASTVTNAVIVVSRYSGVDAVNPTGSVVSGNTIGVSDACSGGADNGSYTFNLTTTTNGSLLYGAATMREKIHSPGAGYAERVELLQGGGGSGASCAVSDKSVASPSSTILNGTFSGPVDWAVIGLEIRPQGSAAKLAANLEEEKIENEQLPPNRYQLFPSYPNPFNAETTIEYTLPEETSVKLAIYNVRGQLVRTLMDGRESDGMKRVLWNGKDELGNNVGSGIYFIRLEADQRFFTQRIVLQK